MSYKQISDELNSQLRGANKLDLVTWVAGGYLSTRLVQTSQFGTGSSGYAVHWNDWLTHQRWVAQGRQGEEPPQGREPPAEWKRYIQARIDWTGASSDAEFNRLGREVFAQHADLVPVIGTVGKVLRPIIINNRVRNIPRHLAVCLRDSALDPGDTDAVVHSRVGWAGSHRVGPATRWRWVDSGREFKCDRAAVAFTWREALQGAQLRVSRCSSGLGGRTQILLYFNDLRDLARLLSREDGGEDSGQAYQCANCTV